MRSSAWSSPTDTRTVFSVIPAAARAVGVIEAWLMVVGKEMSDSMPPSDSATSNSRLFMQTFSATGRPSRTSKASIAPKPFCWRLASSCCGCDSRPG